MFSKVLIANRGEIALRVIRACQEMGVGTVAVHSTADSAAMHVRLADEAVCIGPPAPRDSYLNKTALLTAAHISGADAIHPGVGFLSEDAAFAQMAEDHGLAFVGPSAEHILLMGDKLSAKAEMRRLGVPVTPGGEEAIADHEEARRVAESVGFPILIKAAAGGGGRGMQRVEGPDDLDRALSLARRESEAAFGSPAVYIERFLDRPRHIEVQVLGDGKGAGIHLGERECSIQRRFQKVIEEAPSVALSPELRAHVGRISADAVARMAYRGAGTLEFLMVGDELFFIEMNTRLQVEHPVTELVTGSDLVKAQLRIAAGEHEPLFDRAGPERGIAPDGHSIEARVIAEDPETFRPSPGRVTRFHPPGGPGVRVDSALYAQYTVPSHYDSLIAKLVVHAPTRPEAILRMRRALREFVIDGIATNLPLLERIVGDPAYAAGDVDITWLERWMAETATGART